ncbi:MAG: BON domain-containing protein [Polaromonas sp.]|uniref:BON domain-containing protein n=1 Tax=Polaromonas sp. TaxID=1869339 RepID=UPI00248A1CAC|nr:BON domain-containing protein [Polaromonas sp.]MDI1269185.1 BON domain-containing protein [Polaromonas sp.]MDO9114025.1 BON domain-containing protein [Polaromonas sp.]MDP1888021.1 BON domain-containing protein [Polaromonas sp.]MDP3828024.1 BON domain-containing protein [Polaromonas sp.]
MNPTPLQARRPLLALACSAAVLLALTACNKADDGKTVGQSIDSGIAKTEQAAKDAGNAMKEASKDAQATGSQASTTMGEKIDDLTITATVSTGLAKDPDLSAIKINVDTKDGVVTLNGPAPSAAAKDKATEIAKQVKGVTSVNNQLTVTPG